MPDPTQPSPLNFSKAEVEALVREAIGLKPKVVAQHNAKVRQGQPYYKENYARELIPVLEAMLLDGKDRMYKYAAFRKLKKHTLMCKIQQSFNYLLDHLDPKGVYTTQRDEMLIREEPVGVALRWRRNLDEPLTMPDIVEKDEEHFTWKQKMDRYLSDGLEGEKLELPELALTESEMMEIRTDLEMLNPGCRLLFRVASDKIKIIKATEEQWRQVHPEVSKEVDKLIDGSAA
jgi:hypothetical protein